VLRFGNIVRNIAAIVAIDPLGNVLDFAASGRFST
jgi:hypothetical protein